MGAVALGAEVRLALPEREMGPRKRDRDVARAELAGGIKAVLDCRPPPESGTHELRPIVEPGAGAIRGDNDAREPPIPA